MLSSFFLSSTVLHHTVNMHNTIESSPVFGLLPLNRAPLFSQSVAIKSMWFSAGKDQKNLV